MRMIASVTNGIFTTKKVKRDIISDKEILNISSVDIIPYKEKSVDVQMVFKPIRLQEVINVNNVDLLWKLSWNFNKPVPLWSGYMQLIYNTHSNNEYKKDYIVFLPIIDLNPSDMTCKNSTLNFLAKLARNNAQPSIVTFDQPLYWKSSKIINTSTDSIFDDTVVMLGTFHTIMNF